MVLIRFRGLTSGFSLILKAINRGVSLMYSYSAGSPISKFGLDSVAIVESILNISASSGM